MAEQYLKTNATDVDNMLDILVATMLAAGWTNATPALSPIEDFVAPDNGKRAHLTSPGGGIQVNLCTGYRSIAAESNDTGSYHYGTPYKDPATRFDVAKDGTPGSTDWNWDTDRGGLGDLECSWIAVNCSTAGGYDQLEPWQNQPGHPIYNGDTGRGIYCMNMFEGAGAVGPAIPDVWIFCFDNPSTVHLVTRKVTSAGLNVFQHLYFGEEILKSHNFAGGAFFNATLMGHNPNEAGNLDFERRGFGITAGDAVQASSQPAARTTSSTFILADDSAVPNDSDCTGAPTNYWGSGSGNICSGPPVGRWDVQSGAEDSMFLPIGVYENSYNPTASYGWDDNRGYTRIEEVLCFRRSGPDAFGGFMLGALPHIGLTSTEPYVGGNEVSVDGDIHIIFPFHVRSSPWDRNLSAAGSSGYDASNWRTRGHNHEGTGIAIRKPV